MTATASGVPGQLAQGCLTCNCRDDVRRCVNPINALCNTHAQRKIVVLVGGISMNRDMFCWIIHHVRVFFPQRNADG